MCFFILFFHKIKKKNTYKILFVIECLRSKILHSLKLFLTTSSMLNKFLFISFSIIFFFIFFVPKHYVHNFISTYVRHSAIFLRPTGIYTPGVGGTSSKDTQNFTWCPTGGACLTILSNCATHRYANSHAGMQRQNFVLCYDRKYYIIKYPFSKHNTLSLLSRWRTNFK